MTTLDTTPSIAQRLTAEAVGTFFLVTSALLAPAGTTFAVVGLTLAVMVIAIGKVSGAQLNPAVTTGLITSGQFPAATGLMYMLAQIVGAVIAMLIGTAVLRELGTPAGPIAPKGLFWLMEFIGTFLLATAVTRAVIGKASDAAASLSIGLALAIGIGIAGASSGGVLNPAIAISLSVGGILSFGNVILYILSPLLAGALAGLLTRFLATPSELRGEG